MKGILTNEEIFALIQKDLADFPATFLSNRSSRKKGLVAEDVFSISEQGFAAPIVAEELVRGAFIIDPLNPKNLDIDGIDFTVGDVIYETDVVFSKISNLELKRLVSSKGAKKHVLKTDEEFVFNPGKVYYVSSLEEVKIPSYLNLFIDSKSTIGRLGCLCHGATAVSSLRESPKKIIGVVRPYFFPIKIQANKSRLFQGMFTYLTNSHMTREELLKTEKINVKVKDKDVPLEQVIEEDKLVLSYSTHRAYVSKNDLQDVEPVDVEKTDLNWREYFEEINGNNNLILEPGRFYLLGTKENVAFKEVCGRITRDLGGHLSGLWSQFAGIVHAGFQGELTMECKTDTKRCISDGDLAGYVEIDELSGKNCDLSLAQGSYCGQKAPKLPKVFKS